MIRTFFGKISSDNVLSVMLQIGLFVVLVPLVFLLFKVIMPDQIWDSVFNLLGEVPILGDVITAFYDFGTINGNEVFNLQSLSAVVNSAGVNIAETFIVAVCIVILEELKSFFGIDGFFVLAVFSGVVLGSIFITLIENLGLKRYQITVLIILIVVEGFFYIANKVLDGKLVLGFKNVMVAMLIKNLLLGYQAFVAGYMYFYICCLLFTVNFGVESFDVFFGFILYPSILFFVMVFIEYLFYYAFKKS